MYQPELYSATNTLSTTCASVVLNKYGHMIKWKKNGSILEIGIGDGRVTSEFFVPFFPKDSKEIVASDISKEMLDYARKNYAMPKMKFVELDIATKDLPSDYKNRFDNIFSFLAMHRVKNTRKAFQNIYEMLKPGGEIFIVFATEAPMDEALENLSKSPRWGKYGNENWISVYYKYPNVPNIYENIIKEIGYINCAQYFLEHFYEFSSEQQMRGFLTSVNPTTAKIPAEDLNEYIDDYIREIKNSKVSTVTLDKSGREQVKLRLEILIILSSKPIN